MEVLKLVVKTPIINKIVKNYYTIEDKNLCRQVMGLTFRNPVGLAAGFDKNAQWIDELDHLGFGFIEIGTLTPKSQAGNDKPRLFRLKPDFGLINRMGFNNDGVDKAVINLKNRKSKIIVGGNIGKNKVTENADALSDYIVAYRSLKDYVDYFVINVSSPNTPGLRELQEKEPLKKILSGLQKENSVLNKPILLKIAPDLSESQLDDIVEIVLETQIDGVIATNTTLSREHLKTPDHKVSQIGAGGLSGRPLKDKSTEIIRYLNKKSQGKFVIIGVGGISNAKDAQEKIKAGASLVQVYTGFIYEGPSIVKNINKGLL
jgi:dihydroorotate dehydrogenase